VLKTDKSRHLIQSQNPENDIRVQYVDFVAVLR